MPGSETRNNVEFDTLNKGPCMTLTGEKIRHLKLQDLTMADHNVVTVTVLGSC